MFVMHLVCPAYGTYISIVTPAEPFKALVNDHFMHQEISNAIHGKTGADADHPVLFVNNPHHDQQPAWYGKYEEESIILFKKTWAFLMMIFVQEPAGTMHYIAVQAPGKPFHQH